MINCFTEDASVHIGIHGLHQGRKAPEELFRVDNDAMSTKWTTCHFVTHPVIYIAENTATGN